MEAVVPARLMSREEQDAFLAWVRGLKVDRESGKLMVHCWADRVHAPVTYDMLVKAGIERRK